MGIEYAKCNRHDREVCKTEGAKMNEQGMWAIKWAWCWLSWVKRSVNVWGHTCVHCLWCLGKNLSTAPRKGWLGRQVVGGAGLEGCVWCTSLYDKGRGRRQEEWTLGMKTLIWNAITLLKVQATLSWCTHRPASIAWVHALHGFSMVFRESNNHRPLQLLTNCVVLIC